MVEVTVSDRGRGGVDDDRLVGAERAGRAGAGRVKTAALGLVVTVSKIVPPFKVSALVLV